MSDRYTVEIITEKKLLEITAPNNIHKLEVKQPEVKILQIGIQGPPGPPGEGSEGTYVAGEILSGHRAVVISDYDTVIYANNTVLWHKNSYVGITTQAANSGAFVVVKLAGEIMENSWNWIPDQPIYFTTNGLLTQTPPTTGLFIKIIAVASSATSIFLTNRESIEF